MPRLCFANLSIKMIDALPEFNQYIDSAILKHARELSASQLHADRLHHFTPLLLYRFNKLKSGRDSLGR